MIRFRMLGTVDLRDAQGRELPPVLRRPKLLALLAYLAIARPPGFHRRDTLVALLWPELDHAHARTALRQAVHALREALGRDVVLARGEDELAVNDESLWLDIREFERALEAGEAEKALELHQGGLLPGLHLSGVPDFERWLQEAQEHVRQRACEAARLLTDRDEAADNATGAARWARRLTELSPSDERAVRRLIGILDRAGDRAGAVRAYEEFARRLARDLELEPSSKTQGLIHTIRTRRLPERAAATATAVVATAGERTAEDPAPHPAATRAETGASAWLAQRRIAAVLALLATGLLAGGWPDGGRQPGAPGAGRDQKRLAVLPFANLGPGENAYFADGMTEEIAARLSAIDRLRVIGTASAHLYKGKKKTFQQIGTELRVDYVVEGTVRWQQSASGPARVRVTSQLVSTADGGHLWAEVYDEPLDEIFRVQSDIAQKVVRALDVILREPQRRAVEAVPTTSIEAYDYYLRGQDYMGHGSEERTTLAGIRMFEKAVELDPRFALANARLSGAHMRMYWFHYDRSEDRLAKAKRAVDRALELDPSLPEAHSALGGYYFMGHLAYDQALRQYATAAASRPSSGGLYLIKAVLRLRQGDFRQALEDFKMALQLDPGSPMVANNAAQGYSLVQDFARAEALYDRAAALSPDWFGPYFGKARLYLRWDGSTRRARSILDEARRVGVADAPLMVLTEVSVDVFDGRYEQAITRLSSGAPEVIQDQFRFLPKTLLLAEVNGLRQRHDLARAYYDSARATLVRKVNDLPDDSRLHSALGIAYAGLGRKQEAIQHGEKAVKLLPIGKEAYRGYYRAWDLARIYAMVGEREVAVGQLEHLLSIPGELTAAWLRIDPTWNSLRDHPRFQRLVRREK